MSLEIVKGDLLNFPNQINTIAHSCNTQNIFGAGIAKSIRDKYPEAYTADCDAHRNNENQLGYFSYCKLNLDSNKRIINLYTQSSTGKGRMVDYEAFYKSIDYLNRAINSASSVYNYILGFPFGISCGLAGGSWNIILSMLKDVFEHAKYKTYIVQKEDLYV